MERRDFIKLTAISGASATLASCGNPEHQLIRFVSDEDLAPGIAEWKPSVCPACEAGCAVNVRVMQADVETTRGGQAGVVAMTVAKKLEGLAKDPISQGGLCARGQASIQITYHPDRVTQPMKRSGARGAGDFKPVSWDEAIGELVSRLDAIAAGDQKSLACVTRPRRSRRAALLSEFAAKFGAPAPIVFDAMDDGVARRANAISFGHEQLPTIDLARSRFVISFGADLLGTWNSPVAQSTGYGAMRQGHPQQRGKLVQVESRMSLTGANADEWVPVKPGTEGVLALGLAQVILANKLRPGGNGRAAAAIDGWSGGLGDYAPAKVEQITGVAARRIERLARELAEFQPAVAVAGGPALAHTNGLFHALAVNALSELLGAVGQPGGIFFTPGGQSPSPQSPSPLASLSTAKVVLVDGVNPVHGAPAALKVRELFEKAPFVVSFGSFIDDTSVLADLILPDHSFLESWVDTTPESGAIDAVTTVAEPVMKPLHQTRATVDVLIEVAGKLKSPVALPWKTAEEVAKSRPIPNPQSPIPSREAAKFAEPRFDGDASQFPFHLLPCKSLQFGDGSMAHLPWLQEMPDPMTSAMWSSWVELNPKTAERLGIGLGDVVEVASSIGSLQAPAFINPGLAPDIIAMPVGQGHAAYTRYASGRGVNPVELL
ncbi:MAG TPA: molybdopterin-dependent oxidoreductase, partial [Vicinamibacterales bacterium]|nr:molybdopterin-dependent oxidoreductase [Vicinamibacterales bacterium]